MLPLLNKVNFFQLRPIFSISYWQPQRPRHTMRQIAATRRRDRLLQQIASCDMSKSLSLRQNFVAAICHTNSNWSVNSCDILHRQNKRKHHYRSSSADEATCRVVSRCLGLKSPGLLWYPLPISRLVLHELVSSLSMYSLFFYVLTHLLRLSS